MPGEKVRGQSVDIGLTTKVSGISGDLVLASKPGGESGIRTHDTRRYTGFRDRRFRPLSHLSAGTQHIPAEKGFQGGHG